jgi:hypothetical protein
MSVVPAHQPSLDGSTMHPASLFRTAVAQGRAGYAAGKYVAEMAARRWAVADPRVCGGRF